MDEQNDNQTGEQSPDTQEDEQSQPELRRHGQMLAPLFVLALALMAFGYYLGLSEEVELAPPDGAQTDVAEGESITEAPSAEQQRARLQYSAFEENHYILEMRQSSTRRYLRGESEPLETRIELEVLERGSPIDGTDRIGLDREYRAARVSVESADEPVGRDITAQVEALLAGVEVRTSVQPDGVPVGFDWREVSNPQVRRALLLIRDAHRFTTPRFRSDAVNTGETWVYTHEISVENIDRGLVVRGGVDVANKLISLERRDGRLVAVVEQDITADAQGHVGIDDGKAPFTLEGSGRGVVRFDVDGGFVHSAKIDVERVLSIEQGDGTIDQTSSVEIDLRPVASGESERR